MSFLAGNIRLLQRNLPTCKLYLQFTNSFVRVSKCRSFGTKSKPGGTSKGFLKIGLVGITAGALLGTGYSIHHMNQPRAHITNEETVIPSMKEIPKIKPSRQVNLIFWN